MSIPPPERPARDGVAPGRHVVMIARGNVYLSRETCDTFFPGIQSVALVRREDFVLLVPLMRESGGGLLLKIRNGRGDRVIHAQEFFRENGLIEAFEEREIPAQWSSQWAALVLTGIPTIGSGV